MGNPLRHFSRSSTADQAIHALAKAIISSHRHHPSELLMGMCDILLSTMGLPLTVEEKVREEASKLIPLYATAVAAGEPFDDLLGKVYELVASQSKKSGLGQYFTPWPLAMMMAQITFKPDSGIKQIRTSRRFITVLEPACGSGVMILAMLSHVLLELGPRAMRVMSITAIDKDPLCARICALQILANTNLHRFDLGRLEILVGSSLGDPRDLQRLVLASRKDMPFDNPDATFASLADEDERAKAVAAALMALDARPAAPVQAEVAPDVPAEPPRKRPRAADLIKGL